MQKPVAIVVEDDRTDLNESSEIARDAGFVVGDTCFQSYEEAIAFVKGGNTHFDVAVVDVSLESSKEDTLGADLIEYIKSQSPTCFTIAITAKEEKYIQQIAKRKGADAFVFRGDGVHEPGLLKVLEECRKRIKAINDCANDWKSI